MSFFKKDSIIDIANVFTSDKNKPKVQTFRQNFTTTLVRIDTGQRLGASYIKAVIDNQDATNSLLIRTEPDAPQITLPANSILIIEDEIHTFLEITPNAATGAGNFSLSTANSEELRRTGFLGI